MIDYLVGTYLFNMQDMCQLSRSNSDFAIICEGVTIPCHQIFLSNSSKVFAEEIEADHMGNNGTDEKVVKKGVLDVPCSAFVKKNLLRFIYSRELDRKALENDAESLKLGDLFDMESLKDIAERKNDGKLEHRQYGEILFGQKTLQSRETLDEGKRFHQM